MPPLRLLLVCMEAAGTGGGAELALGTARGGFGGTGGGAAEGTGGGLLGTGGGAW